MTGITKAFVGARVFDGQTCHNAHALVVRDGRFDVVARSAVPEGCPTQSFDGGIIAPGFVDLQVNGGGGVMFNDDQSVETLRTIAQAHAVTGVHAILPTLITDTPARTRAAIDAVEAAIAARVEGIIGIHLEGPHLSVARKGAHDPTLIRRMEDDDVALLLDAANRVPNVLVTVAPETTSLAQIEMLSAAGILVSLGHTDATSTSCHAAFDAGARCVTHLFNAMSPLGSREPGLVGATLERDDIYAGLIADSIHVHPATIRVALAAKPNSDRVFLVSDAMATAGSDVDHFMLNGRQIYRTDQRLTLADGTLAGAHLSLPRALTVMSELVGEDITTSLRRACQTPVELLRDPVALGQLREASRAIHIEEGDGVVTWLNARS